MIEHKSQAQISSLSNNKNNSKKLKISSSSHMSGQALTHLPTKVEFKTWSVQQKFDGKSGSKILTIVV